LLGGSWNNNERNARLPERNDDHPENSNNNIGFRVAAARHYFTAGRKCALVKASGRGKMSRPDTRLRRLRCGQPNTEASRLFQ
jgi:hypothetical protein